MSDRDELLRLTRQVKEHLAWLDRGGAVGVPPGSGRVAAQATLQRAAAPATAQPVETPASGPVGERGLQLIREDLGDCTRCKLSSGRNQIVYGAGSPDAPLVFVGEGPGAEEDRTGVPFVGAAGQLLTKMIEAMGLSRDEVYICNIVKCRPPGNRNPEPDEIAACEPFLKRQLAAIRPRMIVCLGKFAAQCLLRTDAPISRLRGEWKSYEGVPLMPTFHPAFLLRNPASKREVWMDLQQVMARFDELGLPRRR